MSESLKEVKMARMLAWFEGQLPPHDLAEWYLTSRPHARTVVNEDTSLHYPRDDTDRGCLRGYARCVRCNARFEVPDIGNFCHALDDESVAKAVERAKDWVRRDADQAGPCWGDVPPAPSPFNGPTAAVLDTVGRP